jgi:hypothetical protein
MFKWWTLVVGIYIALAVGHYYFGIGQYLLDHDTTYISWVIFGVFTLTTIHIGKHIHSLSAKRPIYDNEMQIDWYAAEACMGIGMVGTLIGFLIILSSAFSNIDVTSVEQMKEVVGNIAAGMGTALLTSLVGLLASLALKLQLVLLENENEKLRF